MGSQAQDLIYIVGSSYLDVEIRSIYRQADQGRTHKIHVRPLPMIETCLAYVEFSGRAPDWYL